MHPTRSVRASSAPAGYPPAGRYRLQLGQLRMHPLPVRDGSGKAGVQGKRGMRRWAVGHGAADEGERVAAVATAAALRLAPGQPARDVAAAAGASWDSWRRRWDWRRVSLANGMR